jgi:DUF1009 family protein
MEVMGLIAGNGPLPILFAQDARKKGIQVVAVGFVGETREELPDHVEGMSWVRVGELDALVKALHRGGARRIMVLGGIDKRRAMKNANFDERGLRVLNELAARGDDALLTALSRELESDGMQVVGSQDFFSCLLAPCGVWTQRGPTPEEERDLRLGIQALKQMGSLDIGQTVVVKEGAIVAVEAIEGTDQAILRGGDLGGQGAVVIKGSKSSQDMRFDVPVVGPDTLQAICSTEAALLAVEAGRTIVLDREDMTTTANQKGICLLGWKREEANA